MRRGGRGAAKARQQRALFNRIALWSAVAFFVGFYLIAAFTD
jgi:hypothetical protein